jgi:hypothetical protein
MRNVMRLVASNIPEIGFAFRIACTSCLPMAHPMTRSSNSRCRPHNISRKTGRMSGAEAYAICGTVYVRSRRIEQIVRAYYPNARAGATVVEDGVTYGMAHTEMPIPLVSGSERTGYIETCTAVAVVHFSVYNDPANAIDFPSAAFAALRITVAAAK